MDMSHLLLLTLAVPLVGSIVVASAGRLGRSAIRWIALAITTLTLALAVGVVAGFPAGGVAEPSYASSRYAWLAESGMGLEVTFSLGLDGLSLWLFALSALLMFSSVLVSWEAIEERPALYYSMLLLLEFGCLGVFAACDILLFYIFFEFTLIPLFFLIGIWGSEERRYAAIKFFLFTLAGSVLTFLGLLAIVLWDFYHSGAGTLRFSLAALNQSLAETPIEPLTVQMAIFIALFAGFAIKVPLFPLHTWLPLAHVQAPTAGSVILAGVLLKIGTYGFLRFSLPLLPDATAAAMPWMVGLSVAGILYGALVALAQRDIKRLIAYSSVSHLGFCMLGLFALNPVGLQGGTLQMVNHGLSTGALFALVGMLYERYHTRAIADFGGLSRKLPVLAFFMLLFTFSSIGLPGLNGFVGEFMVLLAAFQRAFAAVGSVWRGLLCALAVLAVAGVVLGAWYMLWLYQRVFFGALREPGRSTGGGHSGEAVADLNLREVCALLPLAVVVVWIGVYPAFFLKPMKPAVEQITRASPMAPPVAATRWEDQNSLSGERLAGVR